MTYSLRTLSTARFLVSAIPRSRGGLPPALKCVGMWEGADVELRKVLTVSHFTTNSLLGNFSSSATTFHPIG